MLHDTALPPELDVGTPKGHNLTKQTNVTPKHLLVQSHTSSSNTAISSSSATSTTTNNGPGSATGRKGFFNFWRKQKRTNSLGANTLQQLPDSSHSIAVIGSPTASTSSSTSNATSTSSAPVTSPPARRKWLRYPVRVPILALLLVSLLARSSEGWTSIFGFLCGFILFEGFSAPATGEPNRIDTYVRKLIAAWKRCKRTRMLKGLNKTTRRSAHHDSRSSMTMNPIKSIVLCFRVPDLCCCFRRRRAQLDPTLNDTPTSTPNNLEYDEDAEGDAASAQPLLPPPEAEDMDVLLDVALSVTEDATPDGPNASSTAANAASSSDSTRTAPSTPLHPMSEITESLTDALADTITEALPNLPTVSSLDPTDVRDASTPTTASSSNVSNVVGGVAKWSHMSVSLRFTLYNFHIHLHHWVYLLIICGFLYMEQAYWQEHAASYPVFAFASAFCLGGSVQGLKYADFHRVIWRKPKENKTAATPQPTTQSMQRRNSRAHLNNNNASSTSSIPSTTSTSDSSSSYPSTQPPLSRGPSPPIMARVNSNPIMQQMENQA